MVKPLPFYLHCVPLEGYTPYIMVCILFHLSTLTNLFLLFYAFDTCTSMLAVSSILSHGFQLPYRLLRQRVKQIAPSVPLLFRIPFI